MITTAVCLAALGVAAVWVLAWIPRWPLALLEHFRVQYVVTGAIVTACAAALRRVAFADIAAIATALHALPVAADQCPAAQAGPADGVAIHVLLLNVHTENTQFAAVRQLIADENPDLIGLVETDQRWLDAMAPAVAAYPGQITSARRDNFGIALYARGELTGRAEPLGSELPTIVADLAIRGARLRVILTHPPPPVSRDNLAMQYDQLAAVAPRADVAGPVIVLGDFNTTPWSGPFRWLVGRTGLCDSRAGFGIAASYPAGSAIWAAILRIPIDHLLASCLIGVRDRRIGRDVGSDHLPVILDLVIPRATGSPGA